jgi:hypothetical protein
MREEISVVDQDGIPSVLVRLDTATGKAYGVWSGEYRALVSEIMDKHGDDVWEQEDGTYRSSAGRTYRRSDSPRPVSKTQRSPAAGD